jgi:prolyl-tRNA synthetase
MMARRDTGQKLAVKERDMLTAVENLLTEIQHNLYAKARVDLENKITTVQTYEGFKENLKTKGGFIKAAWCGSSTCEAKVKDETGATIRLRPFEKEEPKSPCVACGEKAEETVYFARSY